MIRAIQTPWWYVLQPMIRSYKYKFCTLRAQTGQKFIIAHFCTHLGKKKAIYILLYPSFLSIGNFHLFFKNYAQFCAFNSISNFLEFKKIEKNAHFLLTKGNQLYLSINTCFDCLINNAGWRKTAIVVQVKFNAQCKILVKLIWLNKNLALSFKLPFAV